MTALSQLWMPVLLASVLVFVASSVIHMMSGWHKGDYNKLSRQDDVMNALRPFSIPPGDYMVPRPDSPADMKSAEFKARLQQGPVFMMTVYPSGGDFRMGKKLGLWFVYILVVSFFAAYVGGRALGPGAEYLAVFRFVGTTAFAGYALALWQLSIWYDRSLGTTTRSTIDGLIYALLTAGTFGWLWPR